MAFLIMYLGEGRMSCVQSSPLCSQTEASHFLQWGPAQRSTGEPSARSGSPLSQFPIENNEIGNGRHSTV